MKKVLLILSLLLPAFSIMAAEHEVKMLNGGPEGAMVFSPAYLKINVGDTVKFVPTDIGHNSESIFSPDGGASWKGELNKPVSATFDKEGVYAYQCTPHAIMAMVGIIQVGDASNKDDFMKYVDTKEGEFAINKGRFKTYAEQVK
ncbi:pseudoazurin [Veronia pacifica]|uniref:Pseudoazurin n=1 Tax=Veronia pacifica TaxID=1080227 RepID=A0A1C3ERK1_9GAMM|nr:pseudoazurin [Veronia pacifica]ODA35873.1 pseudoazurin [Veronia pacifica]